MAAKIKQVLGVEAQLVPEGRGIFDVHVDAALVYSKFDTGEFPNEAQLAEQIAQLRAE